MSNAPVPTAEELRAAEARAADTAESAQQNLNRARAHVLQLREALARISEIGASFDRLAWQLSTVALGTAAEVQQDEPASRSLLTVIKRLAGMARECASTVRALEANLGEAVSSVETLIGLAEQARRALERLLPSVGALADAASKASARRSIPVTVVIDARPEAGDQPPKDAADQLAKLIADGWPGRGRALKN
jgi:ABC-type transporter Mla subunit MlaD